MTPSPYSNPLDPYQKKKTNPLDFVQFLLYILVIMSISNYKIYLSNLMSYKAIGCRTCRTKHTGDIFPSGRILITQILSKTDLS